MKTIICECQSPTPDWKSTDAVLADSLIFQDLTLTCPTYSKSLDRWCTVDGGLPQRAPYNDLASCSVLSLSTIHDLGILNDAR